jgi:hypothetical protein
MTSAPFAVALAALCAGCGYHLVHAVADPLGPFTVTAGPLRAPDAALAAAAEEGARAELSRAGALAGRGAPAEIEIELLRVDEASEGVALTEPLARGFGGRAPIVEPNLPLARGVRVTATGRARIRPAGGSSAERETGDVQASEVAAVASGVAAAAVTRDEAARRAARRLGETLVRRLLGVPAPGEP